MSIRSRRLLEAFRLFHVSFHVARAVELKTNPIRPTIDVVYRAVRG